MPNKLGTKMSTEETIRALLFTVNVEFTELNLCIFHGY